MNLMLQVFIPSEKFPSCHIWKLFHLGILKIAIYLYKLSHTQNILNFLPLCTRVFLDDSKHCKCFPHPWGSSLGCDVSGIHTVRTHCHICMRVSCVWCFRLLISKNAFPHCFIWKIFPPCVSECDTSGSNSVKTIYHICHIWMVFPPCV
jgi:hypothetical protein